MWEIVANFCRWMAERHSTKAARHLKAAQHHKDVGSVWITRAKYYDGDADADALRKAHSDKREDRRP